VTKK
jgi:hypothetical protein